MNALEKHVQMEMALRDLADKFGMEVVEMPWFSMGTDSVIVEPSGVALWPCYGEDGKLIEDVMVRFTPKKGTKQW